MAGEESMSMGDADLDLSALRYLGDELSSVERAEFESLLAESQEAREAVAAAVLMLAAVPLATDAGSLRQTRPCERPARVGFLGRLARRAAWAAVGAAACCLAIVGVDAARNVLSASHRAVATPDQEARSSVSGTSGDRNSQATDDLALEWMNMAAQADPSDTDKGTDAMAVVGAESGPDAESVLAEASRFANGNSASADAASPGGSNDAVDELIAPSWLVAAVAPAETAVPPNANPASGGARAAE